MMISRFIAKRSYHLFQKQTETRGIQTQLIEESLSQQTIIQSFNAQTEFIQRLHEANDNYADYSQSAIFLFFNGQSFDSICKFAHLCPSSWSGELSYHNGIHTDHWTFSDLFLNYVQQYTKPFNDISSVLAELQSALACAERVYAVLESPEVETGQGNLDQ